MVYHLESLRQLGAVLSDGHGGFTPCPELLTESEAIRYLRMDTLKVKNPHKTLQYYRQQGLIRATRIGNYNFYRRRALDAFCEAMENCTHERRRKCKSS